MENKVPANFRGFVGEPTSELATAFLFGLLYDYLPFSFVPTRINDAFPDCEGIDPNTGRHIAIELELLSRNYIGHGHPIGGCDYIVCWRDNWPNPPIPVIALEELIAENDLEGKRFILVHRPGSLRAELETLCTTRPDIYEAVTYFLDKVLSQVQQRIPGVHLDEELSAHFVVREVNGRGFMGVYPHGKLVCGTIKGFVAGYGESCREAAEHFRNIVKGIGVLQNKTQADQVGTAIVTLLTALGYGKQKSEG